jgi:hypothetical protein
MFGTLFFVTVRRERIIQSGKCTIYNALYWNVALQILPQPLFNTAITKIQDVSFSYSANNSPQKSLAPKACVKPIEVQQRKTWADENTCYPF